jgi:glycosyltransferase 2 family protein
MSAHLDPRTAADLPASDRVCPRPVLSWRSVLGLLSGLALGLIGLAVVARGVSFDRVRSTLAQARPLWVALALLSVLLTTAAKILRWHGLFDDARHPGLGRRPGFGRLSRALLAGKLANALLPARAGDLLRIYLAGEGGEIGSATVLGTIAAEKAFDVLFLLLCGCLALVTVPLPAWLDLPHRQALAAGGAALGFLLLALALAWPQQRIAAWVERRAQGLPQGLGRRLARFTRQALAGLAALREPRLALGAGAWSAVAWALAAATNYLLFRAFDLPLGPGAALFVLVVLYAGLAPPSVPGRLGVFHALALLALEALGVERTVGLAYATVLHAVVYAVEIVPGAILLGAYLAARKRG